MSPRQFDKKLLLLIIYVMFLMMIDWDQENQIFLNNINNIKVNTGNSALWLHKGIVIPAGYNLPPPRTTNLLR